MNERTTELWPLLNALCENRLTLEDAARLEQLVLSSPEARELYVSYLNLHGALYWDAVGGLAVRPSHGNQPVSPQRVSRRRQLQYGFAGTVLLAAMLLMAVLLNRQIPSINPAQSPEVVQQTIPAQVEESRPVTSPGPRSPIRLNQELMTSSTDNHDLHQPPASEAVSAVDAVHDNLPLNSNLPTDVQRPVALINHRLQSSWNQAGVTSSERAEDGAWMRRVYLDLTGHIPSVDEVRKFLADRREDKRVKLVEQLLDDPEFARNLTTLWTNLLVGRVSGEQVDRTALQKFLRTSFARNQGWDVIVADLVSAEGRADENGAANFLIAHLNNQAVPATAITARLFLGIQVQCTQCHRHPFGNGQQADFWELNSFFHQTESVTVNRRDPRTNRMSPVAELVSQPTGGPTYYETPNGVMKVVYPKYHGREISPEPSVNRRQELARLMVEADGSQLAQAFVNRTWNHFFGYGFTQPIDDMGPHNPISHPELLRELGEEFQSSGYDIKRLAKWICLSDAYQLSSRLHTGNEADQPDRGETPLFSRVYPRPMSAEQLYDSFLIATKAHQAHVSDWTQAEAQRQDWLKQFIISFGTEENDEANTFDGTVTQALTLMNGPLIEQALQPAAGTYLGEVLRKPGSEEDRIERLCLAALSRKPNSRELAAMHKLVRKSPTGVEGYQDLFWALLNSNEFSVTY